MKNTPSPSQEFIALIVQHGVSDVLEMIANHQQNLSDLHSRLGYRNKAINYRRTATLIRKAVLAAKVSSAGN